MSFSSKSQISASTMLFYIYLLTEIYRNGYYIKWDGESVENAMDDLHLKEGLIEQVMTFLVSRSLLCKSTFLYVISAGFTLISAGFTLISAGFILIIGDFNIGSCVLFVSSKQLSGKMYLF